VSLATYQVAFAVAIIGFVVAAASLVVRFRRARGIERQQLRWVVLATVVVAALSVAVLAALALGAYGLAPLAGGLCPAIISAAIGAAILRYRLYDLDRIISRTLAYGLLTLLLGSAYALVVLSLGRLLPQGSSLAVAAATLAVAAVFQAGSPAGPAGGRPALQPPPLQRRAHDRGVRCPAAPTDRPGHPDRRTAGRGRGHDAADPGSTVASSSSRYPSSRGGLAG
jgi:hypothetical protein